MLTPAPTLGLSRQDNSPNGVRRIMSPFTNDFDVEIQVGEEAIERIFQAVHTAGVMQHYYARAYNQRRVELQISCPRLSFVTSGEPRVVASSRVYYHSRSLSDAGDLGRGAVVDVSIRARLRLSTST